MFSRGPAGGGDGVVIVAHAGCGSHAAGGGGGCCKRGDTKNKGDAKSGLDDDGGGIIIRSSRLRKAAPIGVDRGTSIEGALPPEVAANWSPPRYAYCWPGPELPMLPLLGGDT